jgi:coenzyme F420 hydrogenase subunit beta
VRNGATVPRAATQFSAMCPGEIVSANRAPGTHQHPTMGAYKAVWRSWANDPELRQRGSSGGVLTAISSWMLASGQAARVTGAAAAPNPRRSIPVTITTRSEALEAAGSRYSPVASLANPDVLRDGSAVVAKPCEVSALSRLTDDDRLMLSFFCAGTPSALATDQLLEDLGVGATAKIDELWYRGRGWPGEFTARTGDTVVSADYNDAWGRALGPTTQWRCKVCADGVGENADIVAADYWQTDDHGYPSFADADGISALIARTQRGLDAVLRAAEAGVIHIEVIDMSSLEAVQPLQRDRRRFLAARLVGAALAGRRTPRFRGFALLLQSLRYPRQALRVGRGTYRRVRASRVTIR